MTALLRAELIKLRTTRTFLALTGVAVGTSLLICVLVSLLSEPTQESVLTDVFTADTSALFIVDPRDRRASPASGATARSPARCWRRPTALRFLPPRRSRSRRPGCCSRC